jgi:hypothetical protein
MNKFEFAMPSEQIKQVVLSTTTSFATTVPASDYPGHNTSAFREHRQLLVQWSRRRRGG